MHPGSPPSCPRVGDLGSREYQLSTWGTELSVFIATETALTLSLYSLDPEQRLGRCQNTTEPQPFRAGRKSGRIVDLDGQPRNGGRAHGRLESRARDLGQESVERLARVHAQHRIVVAAHADVADEGGAAAAARARRRSATWVCVPTTQLARPSTIVAHGLLLAGGLGVEVDDDRVGAALERAGLELALHGAERVVEPA